ncbi:hypothetical protein BTR23_06470 [Alkalihalophilus pseudofirmus]|nr:hypothetical protein BTR23_06470 [Alkalihalophilus pseudofirmus]
MVGKGIMITAVAVGAVGTAIYTFSDRTKREKIMNKVRKKRSSNQIKIDKNVGHPDPYDVKDNTMVSEGALYAIQRYNEEVQQKDENKKT